MKTRGIKNSPDPKKSVKTPPKDSGASGGESESPKVVPEAGVLIETEYLDPNVNAEARVSEVPSSDTVIVLDIDLKPESMDFVAKNNAAGVSPEQISEIPKEAETVKFSDDEGEGDSDNEDEADDLEDDGLQRDGEVEDEDAHQEGEHINEDGMDVDPKNTIGTSEDRITEKGDDKRGDDMLLLMQYSKEIYKQRKKKKLDVFIGGLSKEATEEEIRAEFEKIGKVTEVRLNRNLKNGFNKGYAFVRYADPSEALKAVAELDGVEVHGKPCRVALSEENDILYLGNIGLSWKKENVIEALKQYDIQGIEGVTLFEDLEKEECHQGFGFLEFATHKDAMNAFKQLQKRDALFGCDRSAKVAWAQLWDEPDESVMLQVRSVFLDGVSSDWDEQKVKELFGTYGEIEKVDLARKKTTSKRRKFGFIKYATREGALSCIEAINNSEVADGEQVKLKASLAKPLPIRKGLRRGIHGGYPIHQGMDGQGGGGTIKKANETKGLTQKRIGKANSKQRKAKKAKTSQPPTLHHEDKVIKDIPSLGQKHSQGPQPKRKKPSKNLPKRSSAAVAGNGAYLHSQGRAGIRSYAPDGRRESRGRKRAFSDLGQDLRYSDISPQNSRIQLARTENVSYVALPGPQYAVPGPQYARVSYIESSPRVPVGGVAQYAVVHSVPSVPATIIQRQPNYAVYGASSNPVYAQIGRGGTYVSPLNASQTSVVGNLHYSLSAARSSPYY